MKFLLDENNQGQAIQRYETGEIIVNQVSYRKSLVVLPDRVIDDWSPSSLTEMTEEDFHWLTQLNPEIILLGTGKRQAFPHPSLMQSVMQQRIGLEVMDTAAACRTYNILMSEGRRVAAALFMI
jgi:uncharacterized protein